MWACFIGFNLDHESFFIIKQEPLALFFFVYLVTSYDVLFVILFCATTAFEFADVSAHHHQLLIDKRRISSGNSAVPEYPDRFMFRAPFLFWLRPRGWLRFRPAWRPTAQCCWQGGTFLHLDNKPRKRIINIQELFLAVDFLEKLILKIACHFSSLPPIPSPVS